MKIWSWKSAIVLWLFSWAWVSAFDVCLPSVIGVSETYRQNQEEKEALEKQEAALEEMGSVEISEEERVLYYTALGLPL